MDEQAKDEFGPNFNFYWRVKKFFTEYIAMLFSRTILLLQNLSRGETRL